MKNLSNAIITTWNHTHANANSRNYLHPKFESPLKILKKLALNAHDLTSGVSMRNLISPLFLCLLSLNGNAQVKVSQNGTTNLAKANTMQVQISPAQGTKISGPNLESAPAIKLNENIKQDFLIRNSLGRGKLRGGGDAGGGNLLNGRPLESYALDVNKSPEMQMALRLLRPIGRFGFDHLGPEIEYVVNKKSWYIVPIDLPALTSHSIGVHFSAEQGALQDFEEIWIDQKYFDKMTFEGRVQLLVHEIFMGLKVFSFESYYRQCEINKPLTVDCLSLRNHQDRKILNIQSDDYKTVRKAGNIIFKNYTYLSTANSIDPRSIEIATEIFSGGGFDSYFAMASTQSIATKEFDDRDVVNALRNQITMGSLPGYCKHTIVEDLGNHKYRMRAQLQSSISFEVKNGTLQFMVHAREMSSGKTLVRNSYLMDPKDKLMNVSYGNGKSSLTLSFTMGVPAYTMQYLGSVQSQSSKQANLGAIAVGVAGERVTTLAFATLNVRNKNISFYDGKDIFRCLEKVEYICEGPECLR